MKSTRDRLQDATTSLIRALCRVVYPDCDTCRDLSTDAEDHPSAERRDEARGLLIQHHRDAHPTEGA